MGTEATRAIDASDDLELSAALGSADDLSEFERTDTDVVVELTVPTATEDNVTSLVGRGFNVVVGTSGWDDAAQDRLRAGLADHPDVGVLIAPNFSISAVLAMDFAARAAKYFESAEVIELHQPTKVDAPSGTAVHTASGIAAARKTAGLPDMPDGTEHSLDGARGANVDGVRVHSVRMRGLVAHEEIVFGDAGQQLKITTDSFDRGSFMPGVLHAARTVPGRPGLTVGLENYLDL
ncbi:4-hydroxy-tetrahydrodipicolinate reductase [Spelaeicoccus albus]